MDGAEPVPELDVLGWVLRCGVGAEVPVGDEEDLVRGESGDDLDDVGRRAADVHLRLARGGGVDIADDLAPGVAGAGLADLLGGAHLRHGAHRVRIRDQHGLAGIEDLGGLGHEGHAAEHDDVGVRLGCRYGETEGVPDLVGDVLHLGQAVVVRQDYGVAFALELGYPLRDVDHACAIDAPI